MSSILRFTQRLRGDRSAVTALEYGLIAAVVVVTGLAAFSAIGGSLANTFNSVETSISAPTGS